MWKKEGCNSSPSSSVCTDVCPQAPPLSSHCNCKQVCFQLPVSKVSWPLWLMKDMGAVSGLFLSRVVLASWAFKTWKGARWAEMCIRLTGSLKMVRLLLIGKADCLTQSLQKLVCFALVRPNAPSVPLVRLGVESGSGSLCILTLCCGSLAWCVASCKES